MLPIKICAKISDLSQRNFKYCLIRLKFYSKGTQNVQLYHIISFFIMPLYPF